MTLTMTKPLRYTILCLGLLCCLTQAQAGDIQYRSGIGISKDIAPDWKFSFNEDLRFHPDDHQLYYNGTDLDLAYKGLAPWLETSFSMKYSTQEDDDGHWQNEVRPVFNVTAKHTFLGMTIKNRSRIEYRELEADDDNWRYRHYLKAEMPWALTSLKLKPYVGDEVWFRLDGTGFYKNRLVTGFTLPITSRVKGDLYYYWDKVTDDHNAPWEEHNVLGFKLKIAL